LVLTLEREKISHVLEQSFKLEHLDMGLGVNILHCTKFGTSFKDGNILY